MVKLFVENGNGVEVVVCWVLSLFDKHYNKWYMSKSGKKKCRANYLKGKFRFLARKIRFDGQFNVYRYV